MLQIIEEQTDLQMIVETIGNSGETEVILEAYSEEADPSNIGISKKFGLDYLVLIFLILKLINTNTVT